MISKGEIEDHKHDARGSTFISVTEENEFGIERTWRFRIHEDELVAVLFEERGAAYHPWERAFVEPPREVKTVVENFAERQ